MIHVSFDASRTSFSKHDHLAAAGALNENDVIARVLQRAGGRQGHGGANAASQDEDRSIELDFGGATQRADDVENEIACSRQLSRVVVLPMAWTTMVIVPARGRRL